MTRLLTHVIEQIKWNLYREYDIFLLRLKYDLLMDSTNRFKFTFHGNTKIFTKIELNVISYVHRNTIFRLSFFYFYK